MTLPFASDAEFDAPVEAAGPAARSACRLRPRGARYALSPDVLGLPRGDRTGGCALSGLLAGDALHRAPVLRTARHALRAGSRGGAAVAAGDRRSAGLPSRARRRALRGRAGAPPRASAQIFRSRRTRKAARGLDGQSRRRRAGRGGRDRSRAAARAQAVDAAVQSGGGAGARDRPPDAASRSSRSFSPASKRRAARSASAASSALRTCRALFALRRGARVKGRRIVLVDDVLTSGATANAAARALLRAGAGEVDLIVFARVVTGA